MMGTTRRKLLTTATAGVALAPGAAWGDLVATPRQTAGPFYPLDLPLDDDNDLTRVAGQSGAATGEVIHVVGRVLDLGGAVIEGARVELWQANAAGRYHHPGDRSPEAWDEAFQGFGQAVTDATGGYRFKTIRPGLYPGRTRHLHFRVVAPGFEDLTTQMYFMGEPGNDREGLYRRIAEPARANVTVAFEPSADDPGSEIGAFDIVLS